MINETIINAIQTNDLLAVKNLIDSGFDINAQDNDGWTLLMYAHIHLDMTQFLIENGANPFIKNKNNYTALDYATDDEDGIFEQDEVRSFLRHVMSKDMLSCLEIVESDKTIEEKEKALKDWINQSNNINAQDIDGRTALFYVRDSKIAKLLIDNGIDLFIEDEDGLTAYDYKENELMDLEEKRNCGVYDDEELYMNWEFLSDWEEVLSVIGKAMHKNDDEDDED